MWECVIYRVCNNQIAKNMFWRFGFYPVYKGIYGYSHRLGNNPTKQKIKTAPVVHYFYYTLR